MQRTTKKGYRANPEDHSYPTSEPQKTILTLPLNSDWRQWPESFLDRSSFKLMAESGFEVIGWIGHCMSFGLSAIIMLMISSYSFSTEYVNGIQPQLRLSLGFACSWDRLDSVSRTGCCGTVMGSIFRRWRPLQPYTFLGSKSKCVDNYFSGFLVRKILRFAGMTNTSTNLK